MTSIVTASRQLTACRHSGKDSPFITVTTQPQLDLKGFDSDITLGVDLPHGCI